MCNVVERSAELYHSIDGGKNWERVFIKAQVQMFGWCSNSGSVGRVCIIASNSFYISDNFGAAWSKPIPGSVLSSIFLLNVTFGVSQFDFLSFSLDLKFRSFNTSKFLKISNFYI